jgi:N-acetylated-alpha-linked acidic dipeptidase
LKLAFEWKQRPLYNVLARIEGAVYPDEWILQGNHHDAWVHGAADPTSGNVALMESARAMAELARDGWRPARTILFASWDGEEWGLLGSTEWAEKHAEELREKAVFYLNTDSNGKGWLSAGGSHSLQTVVNEVARDVADPKGKSVLEAAMEKQHDQGGELALSALGSGSDYTVFLDHLNIASANIAFGGEGGGGVGHSMYDTYRYYTTFSDSDFAFGAALSRTSGTLLMRMANATVLPFEFENVAKTLSRYVDEVEETHQAIDGAPPLDLAPVRSSLADLLRAAAAYETTLEGLSGIEALDSREALQKLNRLLLTSERLLGHGGGLPNREWFRHQIYAPGFYTGYGVKTLPGIREGVEEGEWEEAKRYVAVVSEALGNLAARVDEARTTLEEILGP